MGPVNHGRLLDGSAGLNELYGAFRVCIEPLPTLGVTRDCEFTCVIATGLVPSLVPGVEKKCDVYPPTVGSTLKTLSAVQRLRHKRPEAAGSPVKKEAGRPQTPEGPHSRLGAETVSLCTRSPHTVRCATWRVARRVSTSHVHLHHGHQPLAPWPFYSGTLPP